MNIVRYALDGRRVEFRELRATGSDKLYYWDGTRLYSKDELERHFTKKSIDDILKGAGFEKVSDVWIHRTRYITIFPDGFLTMPSGSGRYTGSALFGKLRAEGIIK